MIFGIVLLLYVREEAMRKPTREQLEKFIIKSFERVLSDEVQVTKDIPFYLYTRGFPEGHDPYTLAVADELDLLEVVMDVEDEYDLVIGDGEIEAAGLTNVGEFIDHMASKLEV